MPVIYPEGGMPGLLLKQKRELMPGAIDTFKVQLVPLRAAPKVKINGPEDVSRLVREMEDYDRESAKIIHLNTKNYVMGIETISIGSLSASIIHPREAVKGATLNNSANVIFVHNHPSGVCEPSNEDVHITGKLKEAFETVGIVLLDSIIVGKGCHYSLRETGLFTPKTEYTMMSGTVREPSQEIKDKVEFISALTEYIKAPDLERRKWAGEKIQVSKYFKPWFDEFFYEHDRESAKRKLMKFFAANEQGLGLVNHTYYSVLTGYLNAISRQIAELTVRENTIQKKYIVDGKEVSEQEFKTEWSKTVSQEELKSFSSMFHIPLSTLYPHPTEESIYDAKGRTFIISRYKEIPKEKTGANVEIKHEPGKIFPWRVVYAGTDKTVQTQEYPEAMAYYTEREAERGIAEEGLTLVPGKPRKPPLETVINSGGTIIDDYGLTWKPVKTPKTKLYLYITVLTEYGGETVGFYEYKFAEWQEKLAKLAKAREKTPVPKRPGTVSENITNNRELRKNFEKMWDSKDVNNIQAFLNRLTVDTSKYSRANPLPESLVIGAAIAVDGFLFGYHVTDDPGGVMRKLKSNITLCQLNLEGDLGCGLYVSGVPEYWRVRSTAKWEFAKNLTGAQRQSLVNVILSDPNYKKGGGYLADFEVDYLNRDLKRFVETGDVNLLAGTGSQPYNVHITKEIARKAGVPEPKEPGFIKVKLQGKFINAAGLYSNQEIVNRAKAWAVINRPKLLEWNKRVSTQNVVNAWLCSMGYCGAFTKSGFSTNPQMVIWDRKAIIDAWIPESRGNEVL